MQHRNAYAIPAKARKNAGPMVHRALVRVRVREVEKCLRCGSWLDEGDDSTYCVNCEEHDHGRDDSRLADERACANCGSPDFSIDDPWHNHPHVQDAGLWYCAGCLIRILRVRLVAKEG